MRPPGLEPHKRLNGFCLLNVLTRTSLLAAAAAAMATQSISLYQRMCGVLVTTCLSSINIYFIAVVLLHGLTAWHYYGWQTREKT